MVGARVFVAGHTNADRSIRLDAPIADAVWGALADRGVPVCVQIRADGLDQVRSVLERFPRLTVLLDHFARPDLSGGAPYTAARGLFDLARFPNLHFKLTTHNVRECQQGASTPAGFVSAVVGAFGAERIGWGSNFPASDGALSALVNEALHVLSSLPNADQTRILSGTAKALYPQLAAPTATPEVVSA
jgi:predicted TIM-barrel fold metal-dependent hydrolase